MRSLSNSPTRWLALIDVDENLFPGEDGDEDSMLKPQLVERLDALPALIGAACMPRTFHFGSSDLVGAVPSSVGRTQLPILSHMERFGRTTEGDLQKCIYRTKATEMVAVQ